MSLAEAMGGSVSVTSDRGKGSTFALTLRRSGVQASTTTSGSADEAGQPGVGEQTSIREFMRQIGIPGRQT